MEEQSGREFASTNASAGALDAALQERPFSSEISLNLCRVFDVFDAQRHLTSDQTHRTLRATAINTWREAVAAAQKFGRAIPIRDLDSTT
jgi:hypothetical protein